MAPTKNKRAQNRPRSSTITVILKKYFNMQFLRKLLFDTHYLPPVCFLLFIFEVILNVFIIERIKYTEIDWIAYMQEVEGFLNGTLDYKELKGATGPLVYPAGFVYVYTVLYYVTNNGRNIYVAQYIFLILYLIQTLLVQRIFRKTLKLPPYALILVTLTSYRIHSIFVLRLFNDPIAVLLFYISLNLFISNKWILGSILYSMAVSIKMNILLYAPCLLIAYLTNLTYMQTIYNLSICALVQLILGLPFLYGNAIAYIKGSFDLGRVFEHKWTVNYRFLPKHVFVNPSFHLFLLGLHLILLLLFLPHFKKYLSSYAKLNIVTGDLKMQYKRDRQKKKKENEKLSKGQRQLLDNFEQQLKSSGREKGETTDAADEASKLEEKMSKITQLFVLPFFVTNLIGVACSRSLHYQFYSWYFHSLLCMVFCTGYRKPIMFLLLALIEFCWNIYPSTNFSSILLHACHIVMLFGLYRSMKA